MKLRHGLFVLLLVFVSCGWMKEMKQPVIDFFEQIKAGDVQGAYEKTSAAFQSNTDFPRFRRFLETSGLIHYAAGSWGSVSFENNTGKVEGTVTTTDGRVLPVIMHLVRFEANWQIQRIELEQAGVTESTEPGTPPDSAEPDSLAGGIPDIATMNGMAAEAVALLGEAINAEDFTAFHGWISRAWQDQIQPENLKQAFQTFKDNNVDITIVRGLNPVFSKDAFLDDNHMLNMEGMFETKPYAVHFQLTYHQEMGQWRLFGISVNVR